VWHGWWWIIATQALNSESRVTSKGVCPCTVMNGAWKVLLRVAASEPDAFGMVADRNTKRTGDGTLHV
jgi:hypothetical protein